MANENNVAYYAVIPATVRYDKEVPPNAKLLYGEITALCNKEGFCWADNAYFAGLYDVNIRTVKRWVATLIERGYLLSNIQYEEDGKTVIRRCLSIDELSNVTTPRQNQHGGGDKNVTGVGAKKTPEILQENNTGEYYIDGDDDDNNSGAREEDDQFDVEMWITRHIEAVKRPWLTMLAHQAAYRSTDILEYVVKTLNGMYNTDKPLFIKDAMYTPDQVREYISKMSQDTFGRISQGFYIVDESTHRFTRKHVSDPVAYIMTVLVNEHDTPLRKVGFN